MIFLEYKENVIKFVFCSIILILIMFVLSKMLYTDNENHKYNEVITSKIEFSTDDTSVYVEYPRFIENEEVNKIISDNIYKYVRDFKGIHKTKALDITYDLVYMDKYVNIQYNIENTIDNIKHMNVLIDLDKKSLTYITSLYDEEKIQEEILSLVYDKYTSDIYESVLNNTVNNYTYVFNDTGIDVYFNYIPGYPTVTLNMEPIYHENDNKKEGTKYIAFTYDDGPSEYTLDLLDYLESTDSSATFFMIGNKMKVNEEIIKRIYYSNSEIGAHGYTHKKLNNLSGNDLEYELNSTTIIFNEITSDYIKYLRPPYGKYNEEVLSSNYQIITWNVDPKDWLVKDSEKIYNNVIKNACDGCIVLMHDTYKETIDATKELIPKLNSLGYEVVSVSKLMEAKEYFNDEYEAISYIK